MKLKYSLVNNFLEATGYDDTSFCVFSGITFERMKEIADGADDVSEEELYRIAEVVEIHPLVLVDSD